MKKYRAPAEFMKNWINGLKSGDYNQNTETAEFYRIDYDSNDYDKSYCALGVALKANDIPIKDSDTNFNKLTELLVPLSNEKTVSKFFSEVYRRNDTEKLKFSEIAEWLEQNVELVDELVA